MDRKTAPPGPEKPQAAKETTREARLKAALKANMARRKAQARARANGDDEVQIQADRADETEE